MANWPSTLPQSFLVDGFSLTTQKGSDNSQTDVGPTISRMRFTAVSKFFTGRMHMTPAQYDTLELFFQDTLFMGSQPFSWVHPLVPVAISVKFDISKDPYVLLSTIRPDKWEIGMSFEILPG